MLKKLLIPTGIVALFAFGSIALAGVPCTGTSTIVATENNPSCPAGGAFCPAGDLNTITVTVTVLDCYGTALSGKSVTLSPVGAGLKFQAADSAKAVMTNLSGQASTTYSKIGGCGNLTFTGLCQGVTLGPSNSLYCANPDNNGSGTVDGIDLGTFATHYGKNQPCSDYNCSGLVDGVDLGTFATHYGDVF